MKDIQWQKGHPFTSAFSVTIFIDIYSLFSWLLVFGELVGGIAAISGFVPLVPFMKPIIEI